MPLENLDQLREIHERTRQAVDLVDDDDVDGARLNVGHQSLKGRALEGSAGVAAIIVAVADQEPALGALARYIGLAGLPLGIQRVELHVEALLAGFAGIYRAPELSDHRLAHEEPRWLLSPKNTRPFQRVPVMARATAERDL